MEIKTAKVLKLGFAFHRFFNESKLEKRLFEDQKAEFLKHIHKKIILWNPIFWNNRKKILKSVFQDIIYFLCFTYLIYEKHGWYFQLSICLIFKEIFFLEIFVGYYVWHIFINFFLAIKVSCYGDGLSFVYSFICWTFLWIISVRLLKMYLFFTFIFLIHLFLKICPEVGNLTSVSCKWIG